MGLAGFFKFKERKAEAKVLTKERSEARKEEFRAGIERRREVRKVELEERQKVAIERAKKKARAPSGFSQFSSGLANVAEGLGRPPARTTTVRRRTKKKGKKKRRVVTRFRDPPQPRSMFDMGGPF